jgi:hypothetical protein
VRACVRMMDNLTGPVHPYTFQQLPSQKYIEVPEKPTLRPRGRWRI